MRTKADVRRPSCAQPDTPSSRLSPHPAATPSDEFLNFRNFRLPSDPNQFTDSHRPVPQRGVAHVTNAGRDAVDAAARETSAACWRTAKSCRSDAPMLASSLREAAQATVSNKPGHRGEREVSRKTIARGMPGRSGVTVVTTLVCLFLSHTRLRVHRAPGIPCAL